MGCSVQQHQQYQGQYPIQFQHFKTVFEVFLTFVKISAMLEDFELFVKKNNLFTKENRLLLAISGGLDSVCLFYLLLKSQYTFEIAHCNFQLRGDDSNDDESFVKSLAAQHKITCHSIQFDTVAESKKLNLSIQETARKLRYDWFKQLQINHHLDVILTAHHKSDNLETVLINLNRSTGISGLHGIPINNHGVVRPLLFATRTDLAHFVEQENIPYRHDISNDSDKYLRNQFRHQLIPIWKGINPKIEEAFFNTSQQVAEFEKLSTSLIFEKWNNLIEVKSKNLLIDIQKLLTIKETALFLYLNIKSFGFSKQQCVDAIQLCQNSEMGVFETLSHSLNLERETLVLKEKQKHTHELFVIESKTEKIITQNLQITFETIPREQVNFKEKNCLYIDVNAFNYPMTLRTWKQGDKMIPMGMNGHKNISDVLTDAKIAHSERKKCLVLESSDNQIIALLPDRISELFKLKDNSTQVLKCQTIFDTL
jgi:tRNA(Ile)-lysidine synthase